MNWQAVIKSLREDSKRIQVEQLKLGKSEVAAQATVGTSAIILSLMADALERGLMQK